jgi:raffinose/stachyose/melibiose transport system substrate-binding protein
MKFVYRKFVYSVFLLCLVPVIVTCTPTPAPQPTPSPTPEPTATLENVVLTLGAWRISTERMNQILTTFTESHPNITVHFDPSTSGEYDAVLQAQLDEGTAPDLFFLRSFAVSRKLYDAGYLASVENLPGLTQAFDAPMLVPWSTNEGVPYGVPFTASSHGIYYNQDLFKELGLDIPETWEELLTTAQIIQDAGYMPFANATKDHWAVAEIIFMNLAPNFIGGREGRLAYLNGERCFNDEHVVTAYQAVADLAPFLPQDHALLGYIDSLQLFLQGKAAMWMSGSWDITYLEEGEADFAWSVFAVPPPSGQPAYITFHLDVAIGLNNAGEHKEQANVFLEWMTTTEFAQSLGNEMPGLFPMHRDAPTLTNEYANAFLALNEGRGMDIRFAWEELREGEPNGYTLMQQGALNVIQGAQTPQQAADALQAGLAQWFEPAKACGK